MPFGIVTYFSRHIYEAWNRLVKVPSNDDANVTIQTAEVDTMGSRIKKVVTNAGECDETVVCFYEGRKIVQMQDGSGNMVQQLIRRAPVDPYRDREGAALPNGLAQLDRPLPAGRSMEKTSSWRVRAASGPEVDRGATEIESLPPF